MSKDLKKKNKTRWIIVSIVYALVIIWAFAILSSNKQLNGGTGGIISLCVMGVISIVYWVVFAILFRRDNQKTRK